MTNYQPRALIIEAIENDINNRKYSPMNDVLFKFIFANEDRKQVTIDFLNAVLNRQEQKTIKDIQFKNSEIVPLFEEDKLTRFDIFCVTEDGTQIDVEVQVVNKKNMERRTLFYWSQMYLMNLNKGEKYQDLKPAIIINLGTLDCIGASGGRYYQLWFTNSTASSCDNGYLLANC